MKHFLQNLKKKYIDKLHYFHREYTYAGYDMRSSNAFDGMNYMDSIRIQYAKTLRKLNFVCMLLGEKHTEATEPLCDWGYLDKLGNI